MVSSLDKATDFEKQFEKVDTLVFNNSESASKEIAHRIVQVIKEKEQQGKPCVLGLPTGVSPKEVYAELVRLFKNGEVSFKNVITFNLDEYYPMNPNSMHSYVRFMREMLFDHIDINLENCHIPNGEIDKDEIKQHCIHYEQLIDNAGGVDLQLLGIGSNGHIGFNESGSLKNSKTRLVALDESTRVAASSRFNGLNFTPRTAITLGVNKILQAKEIIIMAWGETKSAIVQKSVEGNVTDQVPASYLQSHANARFVLDKGAALLLTRVKTPWRVEEIHWDSNVMKSAVIRLAIQKKKNILELQDADYIENGMSSLLATEGPAYVINKMVVNELAKTIEDQPFSTNKKPTRILIFSPHPDDDIISMGATFRKLVEQGLEVHVAYQTSGNIAVADDEALRFISFSKAFNDHFRSLENTTEDFYSKLNQAIVNKTESEKDSKEIRYIKGLIRESEAKSTCRYVGIPEERIHFLKMPFYETGEIKKLPLSSIDIDIISDKISAIEPDVIFAAGDLADPHGTHKVCLDAIYKALQKLKGTNSNLPELWLYRGAWQEWPIEEIELAVPFNKEEVLLKRHGIFKHQSQKDGVVFQGSDSREFWQRAEDRNKETAGYYSRLGLASYSAMEAFVKAKY